MSETVVSICLPQGPADHHTSHFTTEKTCCMSIYLLGLRLQNEGVVVLQLGL